MTISARRSKTNPREAGASCFQDGGPPRVRYGVLYCILHSLKTFKTFIVVYIFKKINQGMCDSQGSVIWWRKTSPPAIICDPMAMNGQFNIQSSRMGKVQNMDPWSMDPLRGPGPWTGSIKIWTGSMDPLSWTGSMDPLIMDRVHGPPIFTS